MYVNEVVARVIFLFKDVMTYEITFVASSIQPQVGDWIFDQNRVK